MSEYSCDTCISNKDCKIKVKGIHACRFPCWLPLDCKWWKRAKKMVAFIVVLSGILLTGCVTPTNPSPSSQHKHCFQRELVTFQNVSGGYSVWALDTCNICGTIETHKLQ
jgi:hypothetical protein